MEQVVVGCVGDPANAITADMGSPPINLALIVRGRVCVDSVVEKAKKSKKIDFKIVNNHFHHHPYLGHKV